MIDVRLNDVQNFRNDAAALRAHQHGLRCMIDAARAATRISPGDPLVSVKGTGWGYSGTFAVGPNTAQQPIRYTTVQDDSITYRVQLAPGQTAVSALILGAASTATANVGISVDGGTEDIISLAGQCKTGVAGGGGATLPDTYCHMAYRITGLAPG